MGAIQRDGYVFEVEYSVSHQNAAVHVYKDGEFLKELPFSFIGSKPDEEQIQKQIERFLQ